MDYFSDPTFVAVFTVVLLSRYLVPFTIFRWPLPGLLACLVIDAVDQTVFQSFGYDPPFYQGYDKAMDVFYLGMAYVASMRNWTNLRAFAVSRFLFFYRQVGVVAFELSGVRALLLVFPNTFEYFYLAYEGIRARWDPRRIGMRGWIGIAAFVWIVVKLPQEYWIHVAQLDFTDTWQDVSWFPPLVIGASLVGLALLWFVVRPRLPAADHAWQFVAPPLPEQLDTAAKRRAWMTQHVRAWSSASLEKVALVGLLLVIFASILPDLDLSTPRIIIWTGGFVLINVAGELALARRGWSTEAVVRPLLLRVVVNAAMLTVVDRVLYSSLELRDTLAFAIVFSTLVGAYDRFRPVYELRRAQAAGVDGADAVG